MTQTILRTDVMQPNGNISVPIGTVLAMQKYSPKLDFKDIFGHFKRRGIPLAPLAEALLAYRLTENRSTTQASEWINRPEVLSQFGIRGFEERPSLGSFWPRIWPEHSGLGAKSPRRGQLSNRIPRQK